MAALIPASAADAVAARLRFSQAERQRLTEALGQPLTPATSDLDFRRALFHLDASVLLDCVLMTWATTTASHDAKAWIACVARICAWVPHPLPVRGDDVLALGIAAGPAVGRILAVMAEWWIGANFTPDRAAALAELARVARNEGLQK